MFSFPSRAVVVKKMKLCTFQGIITNGLHVLAKGPFVSHESSEPAIIRDGHS